MPAPAPTNLTNAFWCGYVIGMIVTLVLLGLPLYHCLHNH